MNSIIKSERKLNSFGFTLVELILSLSIFAVIMAIVIPSFLGYVEKAKEKQDLLDAKQVLTALQAELSEMYAMNSDSLQLGDYVFGESNTNEDKQPALENASNRNGDVNATIPTIPGSNGKVKSNYDYTQFFGTKIMAETGLIGDPTTVKDDPCCIIFGVGSNWSNTKDKDGNEIIQTTTTKDKYTVYYLFYKRTKDSAPLFYFNGEWSNICPRVRLLPNKRNTYWIGNYNEINVDGPLKGKRLQYYCISNEADKGTVGSQGFWNWVKSFT